MLQVTKKNYIEAARGAFIHKISQKNCWLHDITKFFPCAAVLYRIERFLVTHPNLKLSLDYSTSHNTSPHVHITRPYITYTHILPENDYTWKLGTIFFGYIFGNLCILYLSILNKKQILITIFQFRLFRLHEIVKREK